MDTIRSYISQFNNLPRIKQIILVVIAIIFVLFIVDVFNSSKKQKYNNIVDKNPNYNSKKTSNKIEKLDPKINISSGNVTSSIITVGDVTLDTEKTNVTLYFADWCGHCKQFISSTWNKVNENFGNDPSINLNKVDCTNIKTEIKTPAGMSIKGFPSVILNYKNSDGEYIEEEYTGNRAYEAFSMYIKNL